MSICDDFDAVEDALSLNESAKLNDVLIVTGIGWTPGISNILVKYATNFMDEVLSAKISWAGSIYDAEGFAVLLHTLHIFFSNVPTFRDGKKIIIRAGSEKEMVSFPEPIGVIPVFNVGHPEPITIPKYIQSIKNVCLKGGLTESALCELAVFIAKFDYFKLMQKIPTLKENFGKILKWSLSKIIPYEKKAISGLRA